MKEIAPTVTRLPVLSPTPESLSRQSLLSLPEFNARYSAGAIALSPDKQIMAVISKSEIGEGESVWLWNVNRFDQALAIYLLTFNPLLSVAFSPDGDKLAVGATGKIILLDWKTGNVLDLLPVSEAVQVAFGLDNTLVSSSFDNKVTVWDLSRGEIKYSVEGNAGHDPTAFAVSPDGKVLVTAELNGIDLWDMATGKRLEFREGPDSGIGIAPASIFSSRGNFLASTGCNEFIFEGCSRGKIFIWQSGAAVPSVISVIHSSWIKVLAFSPGDEFIASASAEGAIKFLYLSDGKVVDIPSLQLPAALIDYSLRYVFDMEFLSNGRTLAVSTNDGIQLLDVASRSWAPNLRFILGLGCCYSITAEGDNLNLRAEPSKSAEIVSVLHSSESFGVIDGPRIVDGYVWWKVTIGDETEGWLAEEPGWYKFNP